MSLFSELAKPFPPEAVSWRVGATKADKTSGLALAYIDARDVMDRLDLVLGPQNWQNKFSHAGVKTVCDIGIRVDNEWIWKADGAGDTDTEAEKGALSDAFKRTAVKWGIGRYLYDVKNTWVRIEPYGKSYKIVDGEYKKLEGVLRGTPIPAMTEEPKTTHDASPLVKEAYEKIDKGLNEISQSSHALIDDLKLYWESNSVTITKLPAKYRTALEEKKDEIKEQLKAKAA